MTFAPLASAATPDSIAPADHERARAAVIRSAVGRIAPSIVTIETVGGAQPLAGEGPDGVPRNTRPAEAAFRVGDGPTTGLVWSADGWIVSSSFNFVRNPTIITVVVHDATRAPPRRFAARLVARDLIRRTVLLKVDATDLAVPEWIDAAACRAGLDAVACGRGLGTWQPSAGNAANPAAHWPALQAGIVSACGRRNGAAVQTDAKTSPANYGGPLIDLDGRVLGVIVPLPGAGDEMAGVEWYDSGIGFAVTRDSIRRVVERMQKGETIEPGRLGIRIGDTISGGCRIVAVADPSPARAAGLLADDRIVSLNERPVADRAELLRRLSDWAVGETVRIAVLRGSAAEAESFEVMLARAADIGKFAEPATQPETDQPAEPTPMPGDE